MEIYECPCCGVIHTSPSPVIKTTYWTDDCGCNDMHTCPYHQLHPEESPERPSEEVILTRACKRADDKFKSFKEKLERFAKVKEFLNE